METYRSNSPTPQTQNCGSKKKKHKGTLTSYMGGAELKNSWVVGFSEGLNLLKGRLNLNTREGKGGKKKSANKEEAQKGFSHSSQGLVKYLFWGTRVCRTTSFFWGRGRKEALLDSGKGTSNRTEGIALLGAWHCVPPLDGKGWQNQGEIY